MRFNIKRLVGVIFLIISSFCAVALFAQDGVGDTTIGLLSKIVEIFAQAPAWLHAITGIVSAAAAIAALTKTESDNKIIDKILTILHTITKYPGFNFGGARNAAEVEREKRNKTN